MTTYDRFELSTASVKRVTGVQFSVFSPEVLVCLLRHPCPLQHTFVHSASTPLLESTVRRPSSRVSQRKEASVIHDWERWTATSSARKTVVVFKTAQVFSWHASIHG